jgi:hypothetical protein
MRTPSHDNTSATPATTPESHRTMDFMARG